MFTHYGLGHYHVTAPAAQEPAPAHDPPQPHTPKAPHAQDTWSPAMCETPTASYNRIPPFVPCGHLSYHFVPQRHLDRTGAYGVDTTSSPALPACSRELACTIKTPSASRRGLWVSQPPPANQAFCSQHAAGERSAAPPSPPFCTSAPTAARQCPLGSVLAGEQPDSSRSAAVSRSERSDHTPRPPLPALATDLLACSISRPSASKLSMINMVERNIKSWTTAARISRSERRRGGVEF